MKRLSFLALALVSLCQLSIAQLPNNKLKRINLASLKGSLTVKQGEFQAEYSFLPNKSAYSVSTCDYVNIARDEKSGMSSIYVNGSVMIPEQCVARAFKMASTWHESIVVVKYFENDLKDIGYGMETVYAYGSQQHICDSIVSVMDDGYVFKLNDIYYYSTYKKGTTMGEISQIVWPERRVFREGERAKLTSMGVSCPLSGGDVYYRSTGKGKSNMHYYCLYQDEYMPYTMLVVDGKQIELFGNYTDETFKLKYSYNGKHWMAAANDRFWVDGKMKAVEGYTISDFLISNDGDYVYKAKKNGDEGKEETIVMNGEIVRRHVVIGHFALNAQQKLRFHFLADGQWRVYEDGQIKNLAEEAHPVSYNDDLIDHLAIDLYSSNGKHKLSYVSGRKGVEIDGVRVSESAPFQVVYDKKGKCFRWNAVETSDAGKTDLVLYKYSL